MAAKKKPIKKSLPAATPATKDTIKDITPPYIPIPFPAAHFDAKPDEPKELPPLPPVVVRDFKVACKVTSVATHFWAGTVFVALEAIDGQNLLDFLRKDQEVVLHYGQ